MKPDLDTVAMILLVIGGLNLGIDAVFGTDVLGSVIGSGTAATVAYALMGLSALWALAGMTGIGRSRTA